MDPRLFLCALPASPRSGNFSIVDTTTRWRASRARWTGAIAVLIGTGASTLSCQTPPSSHVMVTTGQACVSCHQTDYAQAQQPLHADELSQTCEYCHTNDRWAPAQGSTHSWPLAGGHSTLTCGTCHSPAAPVYEGTPQDCVSCHAQDRDAALEPTHTDLGDSCETCHADAAWKPATLNHDQWPLEGAHTVAQCNDCHTGSPPRYANTPTDCAACHAQEASGVITPSHAAFDSDCSSCHTTKTWRGAAFEHAMFPLTGGHGTASCESCHTGTPPVFAGLSAQCVDCHQDDRASAQPPHEGFSIDCSNCHSTAAWSGAAFVHTQAFSLTGAHTSATCLSCHTGSPTVFAGLSRACVNCHQQDFAQSPFPGHGAFPTSCQDCHSTAAWTPASGGAHPENRFPTRSPHSFACNECHDSALGPNGRGNADCVGCHTGAHTLSRMDAVHRGEVGNYPTGANRAPNFCLQCHPSGRE
jgi:hypothetical protein